MEAPGGPGARPSRGPGRKQGFGSAPPAAPGRWRSPTSGRYSRPSKVWFTVARGSLSEVFFPALDRPALHGLRFLLAAAGSPPLDDAADAEHSVLWLEPGVPAFRVESSHLEYRLSKQVCCDTELDAVLLAGSFEPGLPDVRLFLQASPHLEPGAEGNDAWVLDRDPPLLLARQGEAWMAVAGPFARASVGFLGSSELFVDLHDNDGQMAWTYTSATGGNVALGAELGVDGGAFQLAVGFGGSAEEAEEVALQALGKGFHTVLADFRAAWQALPDLEPNVLKVSGDGGALARASLTVLRCLEDRMHPGAFVAAPCAPWGDHQCGGDHVYHLAWPRDLCHVAAALLDAGDGDAALRALRYLESRQRPDGGWPQNFALDGRPHWDGTELDQVALPVLLAWRLGVAGVLDHDPYPGMIRPAAVFLASRGPDTPLDRWEDAGGMSPSTLAVAIAALVVAAEFAVEAGELAAAAHLNDVADCWNERLEAWCFLGAFRHYVRLGRGIEAAATPEDAVGVEFAELVRHGVRSPDDPRIRTSLATADVLLRVDTPVGPAWKRYVGDAYGEGDGGEPWPSERGRGRPWPLLAGERAHLDLAMGLPVAHLVTALERFGGSELLLPEQVWDGEELPEAGLRPGAATGSACPLGWAHAEYLRLLVALARDRLPDVLDPVRRRCVVQRNLDPPLVWSRASAFRRFPEGRRVKLQLERPGSILWTLDGWATHQQVELVDTTLGLHVAELPTRAMHAGARIEWTARYDTGWEGRNLVLTCEEAALPVRR